MPQHIFLYKSCSGYHLFSFLRVATKQSAPFVMSPWIVTLLACQLLPLTKGCPLIGYFISCHTSLVAKGGLKYLYILSRSIVSAVLIFYVYFHAKNFLVLVGDWGVTDFVVS